MIEYLQVRSKTNREIIGIIDTAKSVIWHSTYYGVGDFEIFVVASTKHVALLQEGNYITRTDNDEVGIIESVTTETSPTEGRMLIVSGRFAKSILERRHIYNLSNHTNKATVISGKVETAIRSLVTNNAINCSFDSKRNINILELGTLKNIPTIIVDELGQATDKQVSYDNLLTYTEEVLQEYKLASRVTLDDTSYKFKYSIYQGTDRSVDNTGGLEPIILSKEYDNLTDSTYSYDMSPLKTVALIGGEGEGLDRFYSLVAGNETGIDRRETWVDASSLSKKYKDDSDVEHEYTDAQYTKMLNALGKQTLATSTIQESFEANIDVNGGQCRLNEDYFVGDIVTFQDNAINKYVNVRITEVTEVQDEDGYSITPVFDF